MADADFKPATLPLAYCTNVHAGAGAPQMLENLRHFAPAVRRRFSPGEPMGIGLWFSDAASRSVNAPALRDWLAQERLVPFTVNAFPFGDFHQPTVKHAVYGPDWSTNQRLDYTRRVAELMLALRPPSLNEISISTLPLAWDPRRSRPHALHELHASSAPHADAELVRSTGEASGLPSLLESSAHHLVELAQHLSRLERERGVLVHVNLEPEPGCVLQRSGDVVDFFENFLLPAAPDEAVVRRHVRVCHDVCHAAVMFEEQPAVLRRYASAGIGVGKVQVSSAVVAHRGDAGALEQLRAFSEPRYLHQTCVRRRDGSVTFYEDLPLALADGQAAEPGCQWRTHFHVPIFLERFGALRTSRAEIAEALASAPAGTHVEVETYAWNVLPEPLRCVDLAEGIARELGWLRDLLRGGGSMSARSV